MEQRVKSAHTNLIEECMKLIFTQMKFNRDNNKIVRAISIDFVFENVIA